MKSHVSLEQRICLVCGQPYSTNAILLDKRLRQSLERETITGFGMCGEHYAKYQEGYIALVGCDPEKTRVRGSTVDPEDAYRTGEVVHLRFTAWPNIFNSPLPTKDGRPLPLVFVDQAVIAMLKSRVEGAQA